MCFWRFLTSGQNQNERKIRCLRPMTLGNGVKYEVFSASCFKLFQVAAAFWGYLGASLSILGHLWTILVLSWAILGPFWGILEALGGVLGPLGGDLEASWSILGPSSAQTVSSCFKLFQVVSSCFQVVSSCFQVVSSCSRILGAFGGIWGVLGGSCMLLWAIVEAWKLFH